MIKPYLIKLNTERSKNGCNGIVYYISKNRIVKTEKLPFRKGKFENEINIQGLLYNKGYSVPKPCGIFPVKIESRYIDLTDKEGDGFFMERIHGTSLDMTERDITPLMEEASNIVASIEKNVRVRISPLYKLYPKNVMYDERKNRVVLIDFGNWDFI